MAKPITALLILDGFGLASPVAPMQLHRQIPRFWIR